MFNPKLLPKVTVFKKFVSDVTRRETIGELHTGFLIENMGSHLRVWNPDPKANDGNDPSCAQVYPVDSRRVWCVIHGAKGKEVAHAS